ncbi:MAG: GyrI-like domain-containing protein [Terracidiphilus sp.]
MNLTEDFETVTWPETHFAFVEKRGPFLQVAPEAWRIANSLRPLIEERNRIEGHLSLYQMGPSVYRAGFKLAAPPIGLPAGLAYELFPGGRYLRFVLTGPYSQLPAASQRVFQIVSRANRMLRMDFCIEHYANDPRTTPEEKLVTEILLPVS